MFNQPGANNLLKRNQVNFTEISLIESSKFVKTTESPELVITEAEDSLDFSSRRESSSSECDQGFISRSLSDPRSLSNPIMAQNNQIQDLIRSLGKLSRELEYLVEKTKENLGLIERLRETGSGSATSPSTIGELGKGTGGPDNDFIRHVTHNSPVRLNVGGKVFPSTWKLLSQISETRLSKLAESRDLEEALLLCDGYNSTRNEFLFNKQSKNFADILEFYRTGKLHISEDCCVIAFTEDMVYWEIPRTYLQSCCFKRVTDFKDQMEWDEGADDPTKAAETFPPGRRGKIQKKFWDLFEKPHSSVGARIIGLVSLICIILSTVILTLNTLPYFQENEDQFLGDFWVFTIIEMVYMLWFSLEYFIRLISCPSKRKFFQKVMNWVDILAIIPYFITIILYLVELQGEEVDEDAENASDVRRIAQFFRLLRIVKTMRIIRIFKLAKHSTGLQALGLTFRSNYQELGLLILFLGMGAIMFSSLVYVFEDDNKSSKMGNMLDAYWWAIITMTTVGYGDVVPISFAGKLVGCFCAIFGVLVIGLPIPIIGSSFNNFYLREKRKEKKLLQIDEEKNNS